MPATLELADTDPLVDSELPHLKSEGGDPSPELLTVPPTYRPLRDAAATELDIGEGLVLYREDSGLVHHLNDSASIVWHLCTGEATVAQLAQEIAEEYELEPRELLAQVSALVGELDALGLVEDAATGESPANAETAYPDRDGR